MITEAKITESVPMPLGGRKGLKLPGETDVEREIRLGNFIPDPYPEFTKATQWLIGNKDLSNEEATEIFRQTAIQYGVPIPPQK